MIKLALRNMMEHKLRMLLTALGVILGVSMMLAVSILNQSMLKTFEDINMNSGGRSDIIVYKNNAFSNADIKFIESLEEVAFTAPMSNDGIKMEDVKGEKIWIGVKGIDVDTDKALRDYYISEGEWFTGENKREIILNKKSAERLGLKSDDVIMLPTYTGDKKYRVAAVIEDRGAGLPFWQPEIYLPIKAATYDFNHPDLYGRLDIDISDDSLILPAAQKIKDRYGDAVTTQTLTERLSMAKRNMGSINMGFYAVLAVIVFVGCFLIYNTFMVVVMERIQLIGLLRAIGMDRRQSAKMVLVEGVLLGIAGTAVGILLGLAVGWGLLNLMSNSIKIDIDQFVLTPSNIVAACIIGLLMPLVSCIIPARTASRYTPIEALRLSEPVAGIKKKKKTFFKRHKTKIGFVLLAIFIINLEILVPSMRSEAVSNFVVPLSLPCAFLGVIFIIPFLLEKYTALINFIAKNFYNGKSVLSVRNLMRNKNRTSITVAIIIIGITMSIGFSGMFNSIRESVVSMLDKSLKGDILIASNWNMNNGTEIRKYREIKNLPEVEDIGYFRSEYFDNGDNYWMEVVGILPDEHKRLGNFDMIEGDADQAYERMQSGEKVAVVGEYYTNVLGLKVGDTVELKGRNKKYSFEIAGITRDSNMTVAYIHRDLADEMYGGKFASTIVVKAVPDSDINNLRDMISKDIIKDENISVQTTYELRENMKDQVMTGTEPFDVINIVTLAVALFGLMNTLLMSILERRREIGMLRSIGSSKTQVRNMIFLESMSMGLFSVILGTLAGVGFAREAKTAMGGMIGMQIGLHIPMDFVAAAVFAVLLCAFIAAVYPSRVAVKTGIVEAIKGE